MLTLQELHYFNFLYHVLRKEDDFIIPETDLLSVADLNETVKQTLKRSYMMLVTEKPATHTDQLFKQTVFSHGQKRKLIPLKKGKSTELYGEYSALNFAYLSLIKVQSKDETIYQVVPVPRTISEKVDYLLKHDRNEAEALILKSAVDYLPARLAKQQLTIELPKVFYHEQVVKDGMSMARQS